MRALIVILVPAIAVAEPLHQGPTFEVDVGVGVVHGDGTSSGDSLAGVNIGLGGWLSRHVALTVRAASVTLHLDGERESFIFFGPSLQLWLDDHFWLGGIGIAGTAVEGGGANRGVGLDARGGYTFASRSANTFDVSFELTPGYYAGSSDATGIALLIGYQYL